MWSLRSTAMPDTWPRIQFSGKDPARTARPELQDRRLLVETALVRPHRPATSAIEAKNALRMIRMMTSLFSSGVHVRFTPAPVAEDHSPRQPSRATALSCQRRNSR
jgi:hypothetical protein